MKRKHKFLFALCAIFALSAIPLVFTACADKQETAFGEWETVTAPTCEEAGVEVRVSLSDPLVKETRAIPATGHDWNAWSTVTEATCLSAGVETRTCNTCENSDMRAIPALGHNWGAWETELEATCESSGTQSRTCLRDDSHKDYKTVSKLGHDFSDWVITRAPSCTVAGVETRYCRNCNNHTEVRSVEAYGHNWSTYVVATPATCTEDGAGAYYCQNDSSHVRTTVINATGHSYGDWVVSVPATESEDGEDIRVCRRDASHTETRIAPAMGSDGLRYELNSAGTAYSVRYDNYAISGTVYIPAMHNGLPVTDIYSAAFQSCKYIERIVVIGNNLKTIRQNAFASCDKLQSIEIPEGVTTIYPNTFSRCASLKSVSFPSTVTNMGLTYGDHGNYIGIFRNCPNLESITVAEGNDIYKVESGCLIEKATNTLVAGTKNAVIPEYVTSIKRGAFIGSGIESIRIPASIESIGITVFNECANLKEVIFENCEIEVLGASMYNIFYECTSLEKIELPESLIEIRGPAFSKCTSLREVVFGNNLQTIDARTFSGCNSIEICEIPASVTKIYSTSFTGAAVSALTIAEGNTTYFKDGNCLIERETNTLVAGADNSVIPSYVTSIAGSAFEGRNLESIVIPTAVQSIGSYAFAECASLKSVSFDKGSQLEIIGGHAFYKCTALTSIMLPEKLREISSYAFYDCTYLSSVTFGFSDGVLVYGASSLEVIGNNAFWCSGLKSFKIPKSVTSIGDNAFRYCKSLTSLTVESGNTAYKVEDGCLIEIATEKVIYAPESTTAS